LAEFKPEEITPKVRALLDEFKDRFPDPKPGVKFANLPPNSAPDRGEFNHPIPLLDPGIRPYYQHPRPISQAELEILKERIRDLIELGHIRPSTSPWGAPVLFVRKKDRTLRLCIDYRRLNSATVKDVYPLSLITELIDKLKRAKLFTKIDFDGAYHQIQIKPEDRPKSGFNYQLGHFEFTIMTFRFTNASATFQ
jgi:hypothetical protein